MICKICGKAITGKPKAEVRGKFAWCSAVCWKAEGGLVLQKIKEGKPFEWSPRAIVVH
jgi:hypothetical protein